MVRVVDLVGCFIRSTRESAGFGGNRLKRSGDSRCQWWRQIISVAEARYNLVPDGRECYRIDHSVGDAELGHNLMELGAAPVIARFTNQKNRAAIMTLPTVQHSHGVISCVDTGGVKGATGLKSC